ncbi:hypothetical protein ACLMJK_008295 [Lecanora helva]
MGDVTPDSVESGRSDILDETLSGKPKQPSEKADKYGTILIPEPSDTPQDPLNWSWSRKHVILFVLSATAFLPDYGAASGASTQIPQAEYWHLSVDTVSHSLAAATMSLAAGGVIAAALSTFFGRLPVLFWLMIISTGTAAWCAGATSYDSFKAARIVNGLFDAVALVSGLIYIQDMFFLHQHAQKINLWSSFFVLAPFLGPQLAAFMTASVSWRWPFWVFTIIAGICLVAIVLFVDESFYDRRLPPEKQPPRKSRILRIIGVEQWQTRQQRSTFFEAIFLPFKAISKIPVLFCTLYYAIMFAWNVGINNTLSLFLSEKYNFGPTSIGYFYFTPMIAVLLGEGLGHWLHNYIADVYVRRHNGHFDPEARLFVLWLAIPCNVAGLILYGFTYQRNYHYMVAALAWGLYIFALMITTVGLNAYVLDSYPEGAGEVAAWLNVARAIGGGVVTYFQVNWAQSSGAEVCYGVEAAICFVSLLLFILPLITHGKILRSWSGPIRTEG